MKPRNDQCYHSSNSHHHLYLTVSISDLDVNSFDSTLLQKQLNERKNDLAASPNEKLYVLRLDIEFLKHNLKLNETPKCEAYRFDRILSDDRFRGRIGAILKFDAKYNHELIAKEHGFYHVHCFNSKNVNIFDEIKFILPRNMSQLNEDRNVYIEMEKKHFNNISRDNLLTNEPINECEQQQQQQQHEQITNKMNVFILGIDSLSMNHMKRMFPKTFAYLTQEMSHNAFFEHHNSVAENTLGNLLALFSGVFSEENQDLNITNEFNSYSNFN